MSVAYTGSARGVGCSRGWFLTGGKKKKQKKVKASKTVPLNDFLADASTGTKFPKDPPKRMGSWADAMEEKLDAEGGEAGGCGLGWCNDL